MNKFPEQLITPPAESLGQAIEQRQNELMFLMSSFRGAMDIVDDSETVHNLLRSSVRPDLAITEPVNLEDMLRVDTLDDLKKVNKFIPGMRQFGEIVRGPAEALPSGRLIAPFIGRKLLAQEQRDTYFFMGARGDYDQHKMFAEQHGIDPAVARDMRESHVSKECFMRMWILFPKLTTKIMDQCLDEGRDEKFKWISEELFVAYNLMVRLLDKKDAYLVRDGEIDDRYLFR